MKLKPVVMMTPSPGLWLMDGNDAKFVISVAPMNFTSKDAMTVKGQIEKVVLAIVESLPDELEV